MGRRSPEDLTVAGKLLWDLGERTTLDLRLTYSQTESTGSQFVSKSITALIGDPNNTSIKHQGNEPGMDDREVVSLSAKFDWDVGAATLTSITSLDQLDHVTAAEQFAYYPARLPRCIPPGFWCLRRLRHSRHRAAPAKT